MSRPRESPLKLHYRRKSGRREYRLVYYDTDGVRHLIWLDTHKYREAQRLGKQFLQIMEEQDRRRESPSLALLYRRYLRERRPYLEDSSLRAYRAGMHKLLRYLYDRDICTLADLQDADLRGYPAYLLQTHSQPSANKHIREAKVLCNYWGCHIQAKQLKPVREPKRPKRILSAREVGLLLQAASDDYRPMIAVLIFTGMSLSEMLTLTWDQIDFDRQVITATKGIKRRRERYIPMHPLLEHILSQLPQANHPVFPSPRTGAVREKSAFGRAFRRIVKRTGIPHCTAHDLRRTFLSIIVNAGYPAEVAQELAGHADVEVTRDHYLQVRASTLRTAVDSLPDFVTEAQNDH